MSDSSSEKAELIVVRDAAGDTADVQEATESVEHPAKVMRIGTMIKQLLEEVRQAPLDDKSRDRLREIYETSVKELSEGLSPDLRDELHRLSTPFDTDSVPSDAELRVAHAQLVGWLEGVFHGLQAALFAQQMATRGQIEPGPRRPGLSPGASGDASETPDGDSRPGNYL